MVMIDLGRGVKVNAENRCYFKVIDREGKTLTVRTDGGKVPFYESMTEEQRVVIKANLVKPAKRLTASERALEEAETGEPAARYRDMTDKDIVTFFNNSEDGEEIIRITAGQLAELVANKQGVNDEDTEEIAGLQEANEDLKNMISELEEKVSRLENERKVKDEQKSVDGSAGGNAAGTVGEIDTESASTRDKNGTSGTRGRPRKSKTE